MNKKRKVIHNTSSYRRANLLGFHSKGFHWFANVVRLLTCSEYIFESISLRELKEIYVIMCCKEDVRCFEPTVNDVCQYNFQSF